MMEQPKEVPPECTGDSDVKPWLPNCYYVYKDALKRKMNALFHTCCKRCCNSGAYLNHSSCSKLQNETQAI